MNVKGGIAYVDVKGGNIENIISLADGVHVDGLYTNANKAIKSGKIVAISNVGGMMPGATILVMCCFINPDNNNILMRYMVVTPTYSVAFRYLIITTNDIYYITA